MKVDLFEYFVLRDSRDKIYICATCRHCRATIYYSNLEFLQNHIDAHECSFTPISAPLNREVVQ